MHKYEVMFILRPDAAEEEIAKTIAQMEGFVTAAGGKIEKAEKLGRRRLAYRILRQREGFYILFVIEGPPAAVHELERRLKVADAVIKFLTVRVDEEHKRAEKLAAARARKQARKPKAAEAAAAPPPQMPAADAENGEITPA